MAYISKEEAKTARQIANRIGKEYGFKLSTTKKDGSLYISLMSGKEITLDDIKMKGYMRSFISDHGLDNFEYEDQDDFKTWFNNYLGGADIHREWSNYSQISDLLVKGNDQSVRLFNEDSVFYEMFHKIETEVKAALGWFDKSDSMTDYFHTAFYYHASVGKWDKPYNAVKKAA